MLTDHQMENVMGHCDVSTMNWLPSSRSTLPAQLPSAGLMYELPPYLWYYLQFRYCNDCRVECVDVIHEHLANEAAQLWSDNGWQAEWLEPLMSLALKATVFPLRFHTQKQRYTEIGIGKTSWFKQTRHAYEALCSVLDRWEAQARNTIETNLRYSLQ